MAAEFSQGFVNSSYVEFYFAWPFYYVALFSDFSPMCLCLGEFALVFRRWAEHLQKGSLDLVLPGNPTVVSQQMSGGCMTAETRDSFGHLPEGRWSPSVFFLSPGDWLSF